MDIGLIRKVFDEARNGFTVRAYLSRFGGLSVFVYDSEDNAKWQGENILEARAWADKQVKASNAGTWR
jgi:hypothetical protein